ncbi:MAG: hypothetical protein LBG11_01365 [Bifidobacteriaceae bacterium]|jgi:hypothetical protein|nr:hypothetical protein [Bifidobacteriaceae bacterium]
MVDLSPDQATSPRDAPTPVSSRRRRRRVVLVGLLAVLTGALAALAVFLGVQHAKGEDRLARMEAIRAQLQIPDDWELWRESVESYHWAGTTYCNFGATRCPKFELDYRSPVTISSRAELEALLPGLEWEPGLGDCPASVGSARPNGCRLSSRLDGFAIRIAVYVVPQTEGGSVGEVRIVVETDE